MTWGISTPTIEKANLKKKMMKVADQVILVADHTKFYKKAFAHVASLEEIDVIITDEGLEQNLQVQLIESGLEIRIV